ncbi:MAG: DUF924 family protein [Caldilineaceae bacterium]
MTTGPQRLEDYWRWSSCWTSSAATSIAARALPLPTTPRRWPWCVRPRHKGLTALLPIERQFLYMPLMHAEDVAAQQECLRLHTLAEEVGPAQEMAIAAIPFAEQHLEIIRRFGRFPHRNVALGRTSTPDEAAFMADGGPSFGQEPQSV